MSLNPKAVYNSSSLRNMGWTSSWIQGSYEGGHVWNSISKCPVSPSLSVDAPFSNGSMLTNQILLPSKQSHLQNISLDAKTANSVCLLLLFLVFQTVPSKRASSILPLPFCWAFSKILVQNILHFAVPTSVHWTFSLHADCKLSGTETASPFTHFPISFVQYLGQQNRGLQQSS